MDNGTAGTLVNLYLIMRRYNSVYAATGNQRLANKASWHTFGKLWLIGWATAGTLMFAFLSIFWVGWLVPLSFCLACIPGVLWAHAADKVWEAKVTSQVMAPPPIPDESPIVTGPRTQQVLTAFYRPPTRRIRSPR